MAFMDVESLFTNVSINETLDFICHRLYHPEQKIAIPEIKHRLLLQACTKEVPFYWPDSKMYMQCNGVAMGSPLGVLFANFYMEYIEEEMCWQQHHPKPGIYARYVGDIFISVNTEEVVNIISNLETEQNSKFPFLDILVRREAASFSTEVYTKSTNLGFCLNGESECPEQYRRSVINAFVKRALTDYSTWTATNAELKRITQLLGNNNYPMQEINSVIRHRLDNFIRQQEQQPVTSNIKLSYSGIMSSAYKDDEKALKNIIYKNIKPTDPASKIDLLIYCKTKKTSNLVS
ncbi:uncharacterized protein LOC143024525 [Oratosquilla oratoria]|uniref:uncharacterized protein LOC143024525 n=1 Tax=Oratosquilla oratoria TaxID=337810 RepID=UPI003F776AF5